MKVPKAEIGCVLSMAMHIFYVNMYLECTVAKHILPEKCYKNFS